MTKKFIYFWYMIEKNKSHYTEYAYYIRGKLIHKLAFLEIVIDIYIAHHFTTSEELTKEIISLLITPRVSFDGKRAIFKFLVEAHNKEFIKEFPQFNKDLIEIIEKRNFFAHYPTVIKEDLLRDFEKEKFIALGKFKESSKMDKDSLYNMEIFTEADINSIIDSIELYSEAIMKISQ